MLLVILIMQPLQIWHFGEQIGVLFPKGEIALKERNLLFIVQALMLLVILPVYILTFIFSWIYRADNPKGTYDPEFNDSPLAECIWWGLPIVMVVIVSVLIWVKTHELDPFKSLEAKKKELNIQVVALQWKWLFIYPEEEIATVNFLQIPKDTPVRFEITADAPMNSFWIPHLGGQIYAMPGMTTFLNLIANETGDFQGSSANISGEGFANMHFTTRSSNPEEYQQWVSKVKESENNLSQKEYEELAKPSTLKSPQVFQLKDANLFKRIVHQYMPPSH
ncbi:MAG TPA: ubiquinol oxidase subunit II [Parachlamydiaceae bacterium]|nr:ubiquinol oxidase subunit II [Parachlamydiaceae bacterium]